MSGDFFGCHTEDRGLLLSSGWRPEMLRNTLQAQDRSLQPRIIWPQMVLVLEPENPVEAHQILITLNCTHYPHFKDTETKAKKAYAR